MRKRAVGRCEDHGRGQQGEEVAVPAVVYGYGYQAHAADRQRVPERPHRSIAMTAQPGHYQDGRRDQAQAPEEGHVGSGDEDHGEDAGDGEQPERKQQQLQAAEQVARAGSGAETREDLLRLAWHRVSLCLRVRKSRRWVLDARAQTQALPSASDAVARD